MWDQTGSPEIPDREETSEIPRPPFGGDVQKQDLQTRAQQTEEKSEKKTPKQDYAVTDTRVRKIKQATNKQSNKKQCDRR